MIDTKQLAFALKRRYDITEKYNDAVSASVIEMEIWLAQWCAANLEEQRLNARLQELYADLANHCDGPEDEEYLVRDWKGNVAGVSMSGVSDDIYESFKNGTMEEKYGRD